MGECTRCCMHAPTGLTAPKKAEWPMLQHEVATIWEARTTAAQPSRMDKTPALAPPTLLKANEYDTSEQERCWEAATPIDFKLQPQMLSQLKTWPFGIAAWHGLNQLMCYVRVAPPGTLTHPPTLLEFYLQYRILVGEPFPDGWDPRSAQGGLGVQLASFRSALETFQKQLTNPLLQQGPKSTRVKSTWGALFGLPQQERL